MGKIICEICGTVYPDSADACPICGFSREMRDFPQGEDLRGAEADYEEPMDSEEYGDEPYDEYGEYDEFDFDEKPYIPPKPPQGKSKIFDYDAVNPQDRQGYQAYQDNASEVTLNDYPEESYDNYDGYSGEPRKKHTGLVVFLIVLILLLFAASGLLVVKVILPNLGEQSAQNPAPEITIAPQEVVMTEAPTTEPTTEPTIPCTSLVLVDGANVELVEAGQFFLIHAAVSPEDTTDQLTYTSEDESVATVDEMGKITAVAEGSTNILLTCGSQSIRLPVQVGFVPDTEPVEDTLPPLDEKEASEEADTAEETAQAETEAPEETQEETKKETKPINPDIVLKLKDKDRSSGIRGVSFQLNMDCELQPEDVEWSTSDSTVATVKDGLVTTVGPGICTITAKYGDQTATCIIRCTMQ